MSIALYALRSQTSYDAGVPFDLQQFRAALRTERETRVGGRDTLAEKAGVNRTTIQNAESGPDIPGIDTVAKLIEATGLSLSAFFAQLEGVSVKGLHDGERKLGDTLTNSVGHKRPLQNVPNTATISPMQGMRGGDDYVDSRSRHALRSLGKALVATGTQLTDFFADASVDGARPQDQHTRKGKPKARGHRARTR